MKKKLMSMLVEIILLVVYCLVDLLRDDISARRKKLCMSNKNRKFTQKLIASLISESR